VRVRACIGIDRALLDRNLLGAALGDAASWSRWLSVLRAAFALPMSDADCITFAEVAGGRAPPSQRIKELWCVCGRRSGKTRIAAAISVFIAAIEQHKLASGEIGYVLLLAASRAQASVAFSYVTGFLQSSAISRQQIESMTADEVRLKGNIIIGVHAGNYRTIRGRSLLAVVGDETSYWRDVDSAQPDVEIFRACAPALAATRGPWVGISTGYRKLGLLYQKWRDHFGVDGDDVLVVQGASSAFNPSLDLGMIERVPRPLTRKQPRANGVVVFVPTSAPSSMTQPSKQPSTTVGRSNCRHSAVTPSIARFATPRAALGPTATRSPLATRRAHISSLIWCAAPVASLIRTSSRRSTPRCSGSIALSR
jgi:hypothetical protein